LEALEVSDSFVLAFSPPDIPLCLAGILSRILRSFVLASFATAQKYGYPFS